MTSECYSQMTRRSHSSWPFEKICSQNNLLLECTRVPCTSTSHDALPSEIWKQICAAAVISENKYVLKFENKLFLKTPSTYIIGEKPCEYLKDVVHLYILNELQLFNLSKYYVYNRHYSEDVHDRECMCKIHDREYYYMACKTWMINCSKNMGFVWI